MIRIFCDTCKEEITGNEMGNFTYIERAPLIVFDKHQKKDQEGFVKKEITLCPKCLKRVKEVFKL